MAQVATARFFSFKMALISLAAVLVGLALGAYCVFRIYDENRISIGGFLLAGGAIVLGIGTFFATAFPTGCRACKKVFSDVEVAFPPDVYDYLCGAIQTANPNALMQLLQAPIAPGDHWVKVSVSYCKSCHQVGELSVDEERTNPQTGSDDHVRGSGELPLAPHMIGAVLHLIQQRGGSV